MSTWILIGFLSFLFLLDGTILPPFLPQDWGSDVVLIPQLVVSGIIILSLYRGRRIGLLYGFFFGLFYDLAYGGAVGIYAFSTASIGYIAGQISRQFVSGPIMALLTTGIGQAIHLSMVYGWVRLFQLTQVGINDAFIYRIIPSILFNTLIAFPIYHGIQWIFRRYSPHSGSLFGKR
ncbi:rod shape-determining protein MreD [Marininema mesophilum]|uniref:Rod shape-determining protein MreD n=1 Tax=Marininema mesophilum TaxID=1048340 RepID=A0A1H2S3R7_9BACL|nr:rod shape-determining protein MreD [Marininema mesophilum]SDW26150.1 rod shape-determining protein MreD [Marininema mesophilum]